MYKCISCNYECSVKCNYTKHLSTRKHKKSINKEQRGAEKDEKYNYAVDGVVSRPVLKEANCCMDPLLIIPALKSIKKYKDVVRHACDYCNVTYVKKSNYLRHLTTEKHKHKTETLLPDNNVCEFCGKTYSYASGLRKHVSAKHFTLSPGRPADSDTASHTRMETFLMRETQELRQTIIDISKQLQSSAAASVTTNNTVHSHNNSNNKTFNLNFFLNETCKNAMNISEFIKTIQVSLTELERVGEIGFVKGIADIITTKLNGLALTKRPIHCSDIKRETLYVKDENEWTKEVVGNPKMKHLIQHVSHKNLGTLGEWREEHPDHSNPAAHESTRYQCLIAAACNGGGDTNSSSESIIKRVAKQVCITK